MTVALACVAFAFALIWVPRCVVVVAQARQPGGYDNRHPRDQQAQLRGWGRRAQAAHMNAFESFAPFAAAVLIAHLGQAERTAADGLAITHVIARGLYTACYLADWAWMRTAVWIVATGCTGALFVLPFLD